MKQILSIDNTLIISDTEAVVLAHPTTVFTDDNVTVQPFTDQLVASGMRSELVDSALNQIAEIEPVIEVISLEDSPRTSESDEAVEKLLEKGSVIITTEA